MWKTADVAVKSRGKCLIGVFAPDLRWCILILLELGFAPGEVPLPTGKSGLPQVPVSPPNPLVLPHASRRFASRYECSPSNEISMTDWLSRAFSRLSCAELSRILKRGMVRVEIRFADDIDVPGEVLVSARAAGDVHLVSGNCQ